MPTYDYRCQECGRPFEVRMSMSAYSEGAKPSCPECGSEKVERSFSGVNVVTGSGTSGSRSSGAPSCGPSGFT